MRFISRIPFIRQKQCVHEGTIFGVNGTRNKVHARSSPDSMGYVLCLVKFHEIRLDYYMLYPRTFLL